MKTLKYIKFIICIGLISIGWSCKNDPWSDIEKGDWNHDRMILEIQLQGQAGTATITSEDANTGTIELALAVDIITDLSKVKVEKLTLSYKATATVNTGEIIDFTSGDPNIVVTSPTGQSRTYTIVMSEFSEDLVGIYDIHDVYVYGGTGPAYGGAVCWRPHDKPWRWNQSGEGPSAEIDNVLEFTMSAILDDGNTTGTCKHNSGSDGKYWDCIFAGSSNPETPGEDVDLNHFYRQIPKGESTWVRDYSAGTITFTDANGRVTVGQLMQGGAYTLYQDESRHIQINIPDQAFRFALSGQDDWTYIFSDYDKFVKRPRVFFTLIEKR